MSSSLLQTPVRVPELGPSLGRLTSEKQLGAVGLDELRLKLVSRIFEHAGEARRRASEGDRAGAVGALSPATWLGLWEDTAGLAADALLDRVEQELGAAARSVRLPRSKLEQLKPGAPDRRVVAARLGSAGATLVDALTRLEEDARALIMAEGHDPAALNGWQEQLRRSARRLEESWFALEERAATELAEWRLVVDRVRRWRPAIWPVVVFVLLGEGVAVWLGLVIGGYVAPPPWLQSAWSSIFG